MLLMWIVYVEDGLDIRKVVATSLRDMGGFEVCPFQGSRQAVQEISEVPTLSTVSMAFLTAQIIEKDIQALKKVAPVIAKPVDVILLHGLLHDIHAQAVSQHEGDTSAR